MALEIRHRPLGTGGEIIIAGLDKAEVKARAQQEKDAIDFMRSPYIAQDAAPRSDGFFVSRVMYFGLD